METKIKTAPIVEPVSLNELKDHLHIEHSDTDHDDYLDLLIKAVRGFIEEVLNRKLITQTWYLYLDDWPIINEYFEVPFGNLQSVTSIKYKGTNGAEVIWDSANYIVATEYDVGRIVLGHNKSWPTSVLYPSLPITVEFVCGYGNAGTTVSNSLLNGMKKIMSEMYVNREIKPSSDWQNSLAGSLILQHKIWQVY